MLMHKICNALYYIPHIRLDYAAGISDNEHLVSGQLFTPYSSKSPKAQIKVQRTGICRA